MEKSYDFCGWVTRNDVVCDDGRVIRHDAFKVNDGDSVPLVWDHKHGDMENIVGHIELENRDTGVYGYGYLNHTAQGNLAKDLIMCGDITRLSIFANKLKQIKNNVIHGMIREVSLVAAGANPGAYIEEVIAHSSDEETFSALISTDDMIIEHSSGKEDQNDGKSEEDSKATNEENTKMEEKNKEADNSKSKTVGEVLETLDEEQTAAVLMLLEEAKKDNKENNTEEGDKSMKHNAFETNAETEQNDELMHSALNAIIEDAKHYGSLKKSFLAHTGDEYGITNIDWLFPDYQSESDTPGFVKRNPSNWVSVVMNGVHHTAFAKVKMIYADLRGDDARAKGYATKGSLKKDEVITLLRRTIEPTTVYKKQKIDRDDEIDITNFNVISWLKGEMRLMLDEELVRGFLFGDGRGVNSDDKIKEDRIIPAISDAPLFTIQKTVASTAATDIVDGCTEAMTDYEGSGDTTAFLATNIVTQMLLIKNTLGERIYKDINELAAAMGVNRIVRVPAAVVPAGKYGVILDLADYGVGADKGGSVNMFDDFDIDYNQEKYLIETRCSGGLRKPFSAISLNAPAAGGNEQG